MTGRKPAPSPDEIDQALLAATQGRGRKLATLVKSFSLDDLAAAFAKVGQDGISLFALARALNFAAGRKEQRERMTADLRTWRKQRKAAQ